MLLNLEKDAEEAKQKHKEELEAIELAKKASKKPLALTAPSPEKTAFVRKM